MGFNIELTVKIRSDGDFFPRIPTPHFSTPVLDKCGMGKYKENLTGTENIVKKFPYLYLIMGDGIETSIGGRTLVLGRTLTTTPKGTARSRKVKISSYFIVYAASFIKMAPNDNYISTLQYISKEHLQNC